MIRSATTSPSRYLEGKTLAMIFAKHVHPDPGEL